MPVTFGSVGDIIAICLLVKDLANALNDSCGSAVEYQETIRELCILDRTLLEVEILVRTHEHTIELNALCETARRTITNLQGLVERFFERVKKYENSLGDHSRGEKWRSNAIGKAARKAQWRMGEKEELEKFRAEIAANSASLGMLLAAANIKLQTLSQQKIEDGMRRSDEKTSDAFSKQDKALQDIISRLEETNKLIEKANAGSGRSGMESRADWANQLGQDMKKLMLEVIATNLATYKAVVEIQKAAPIRPITEETFLLEDAIGRIAPVPLQYIDSWDAFDAILEIRFRNRQGFNKILKKEYVLQDQYSGKDINRSTKWGPTFVAEQKIDMSMLFKQVIEEDDEPQEQGVTCPRCGLFSNGASDADLQCAACGIWYRRISTVEDNEPDQLDENLPAVDDAPDSGRTAEDLASLDSATAQRAKEAEDDITKFKRVRLRLVKKQKKNSTFTNTPTVVRNDLASDEPDAESMDNNASESDASPSSDGNAATFVRPTANEIASRDYIHRSRVSDRLKSSDKRNLAFSPKREATTEDARRHRIPTGYSLKNWDATEAPILVAGSVFDCNSFGKWVYDWTIFHWSSQTPQADIAGELWLLLIKLANKTNRAERAVSRIRNRDNRDMVDDFLIASDHLFGRLTKVIKTCTERMVNEMKSKKKRREKHSGCGGGCEFVEAMFGRDGILEMTEKLMTGLRLWSLRFDHNCEDILADPNKES